MPLPRRQIERDAMAQNCGPEGKREEGRGETCCTARARVASGMFASRAGAIQPFQISSCGFGVLQLGIICRAAVSYSVKGLFEYSHMLPGPGRISEPFHTMHDSLPTHRMFKDAVGRHLAACTNPCVCVLHVPSSFLPGKVLICVALSRRGAPKVSLPPTLP